MKPTIKTRKGVVVSNKMDKTVVVRIERVFKHPVFGKTVKSYKKFKAHDADNKCNSGDVVLIKETRPISRDKRWKVVSIIGFERIIAKQFPGRLHKKEQAEGSAVAQQEEIIKEGEKQ